MKLSKNRFYKSGVTMLGHGGYKDKYNLYSYETANSLYDVAVPDFIGATLYRKNMGRWTYYPSKVHIEIINHFNINRLKNNPGSNKKLAHTSPFHYFKVLGRRFDTVEEADEWAKQKILNDGSNAVPLDIIEHMQMLHPHVLYTVDPKYVRSAYNPSKKLRSLSKRRYADVNRSWTPISKKRMYRKSRAGAGKIFSALLKIPLNSKRRKSLSSKMRKRQGLKYSYFHKTYGN